MLLNFYEIVMDSDYAGHHFAFWQDRHELVKYS